MLLAGYFVCRVSLCFFDRDCVGISVVAGECSRSVVVVNDVFCYGVYCRAGDVFFVDKGGAGFVEFSCVDSLSEEGILDSVFVYLFLLGLVGVTLTIQYGTTHGKWYVVT